ncbi:unnamed protein product [Larinioides sclopetarius]|uniref:LAGLIDADG homing endonuclease n=1 Tax=Larinioides sclopetarius TaxID=280406 RepID=A0AAV1Z7G4_9ARAC
MLGPIESNRSNRLKSVLKTNHLRIKFAPNEKLLRLMKNATQDWQFILKSNFMEEFPGFYSECWKMKENPPSTLKK